MHIKLVFVFIVCGIIPGFICQEISSSSTSNADSTVSEKSLSDHTEELTTISIEPSTPQPTEPSSTVPPTESPTTQPTAPPTSPAPTTGGHNYFNVSSDGTICTMFFGDFLFTVSYNTIDSDKVNVTKVEAPKLIGDNVTVTGSCDKKGQWIKVQWGSDFLKSSIKLNFTSNNETWKVNWITSELFMDKNTFPNATNSGQVLISSFNMTEHNIGAAVNSSYKCFAEVFLNGTTIMNGEPYEYPLKLSLKEIQVQAYNKISNKLEFADAMHCDADRIADIVPIAVGCALAGLVIIVVVAYFVGRRRRTLAYQSV